MSKQVWGTFSVKDHCDPSAFVAEVMLYDRLVIPRPPDERERSRWSEVGWHPDRLDVLLQILGERAYVVDWNRAAGSMEEPLCGRSRHSSRDR